MKIVSRPALRGDVTRSGEALRPRSLSEGPSGKWIEYGDKGEDVRKVQGGLNTWSLMERIDPHMPMLEVDGMFGSMTKGRVNTFKSVNKIRNTGYYYGVVDQETWDALKPYMGQSTGVIQGTGETGLDKYGNPIVYDRNGKQIDPDVVYLMNKSPFMDGAGSGMSGTPIGLVDMNQYPAEWMKELYYQGYEMGKTTATVINTKITIDLANSYTKALEQQGNTISNNLTNAENAAYKIQTPYGEAVQSMVDDAFTLRQTVDNGGQLYRSGTFGKSNVTDAQFWASENPLSPGYANKYGLANSQVDYVIGGTKVPGAPYVTRTAPPVPPNLGGGIEVVTNPNSVRLNFFHMP